MYLKFKNYYNHFKKICQHKFYVFIYCYKAGIPIQGILHDLSKFSPVEFLESSKYYTGDKSPIDNCKKVNGYSMAWFHHRGRNKHHWEYWVDNFEQGMTPTKMPYKYAVEMLCDFLGAGKAYMGKDFTYEKEKDWWEEKKKKAVMEKTTMLFIDVMMNCLCKYGEKYFDKKNIRKIYDESLRKI